MDTNDILLPSLRAHMGDWVYYVSTMTFEQVSTLVIPVGKIDEHASLRTWIQRELNDQRREEIVAYLRTQEQRFFGTVILGIFGGTPEWHPVEIERSIGLRGAKLNARVEQSFGLIRLTGNEQVFPLDGQHRVEGIKDALNKDECGKLKEEVLSVIFVAHERSDAGRQRTRRLFSTLNRYARPVSKAELVALSEDDHFANVTRDLIDNYPGLSIEFVPLTKTANLPREDRTSITNVLALYNVVKAICVPPGTRKDRRWEHGPPDKAEIDRFNGIARQFWDALQAGFSEMRKAMHSKPEENVVSRFRHAEGGHFLFRPYCLVTFAKAVSVMVARGKTVRQGVQKLSAVPLEISGTPWLGLVWDSARQAFVAKRAGLVKNVLLLLAGEVPDGGQSEADVRKEYTELTGRDLEAST